jgi:Flp pilus assembly protein TadB
MVVDLAHRAPSRAPAVNLIAAVLAALAAWFAVRPPLTLRAIQQVTSPDPPSRLTPTVLWLVTALAALSVFLTLGGILGGVASGAMLLLAPAFWRRIVHRQPSSAALIRQIPIIADMLSAAVLAGVHVDVALKAIADAIDEPAATSLRAVVHARSLGAPATEAWSHCPAPLHPIAQALIRTERSGAGLAEVLIGVADDARREHRTCVEVAARTAGVRSVAPLAACFLPAFLLVGVVPVVVSLAEGFTSIE